MNKKRMKSICGIFYDAGLYNAKEDRFNEMFEYYWDEIKKDYSQQNKNSDIPNSTWTLEEARDDPKQRVGVDTGSADNHSHNPEELTCAGVEKKIKPVETPKEEELLRQGTHKPSLTSPRDNKRKWGRTYVE